MSDLLHEAEKLDHKIKRGFVDNIDQNEINLCFGLLVAEIQRLRVLDCVAEKNMARRDEDISNLVRELAVKDALNNDLMANCNQLRDRCWKAEGELARWQKIAINERAKQMNGPCEYRTRYEWCDKLEASCDGFPHMFGGCPIKETWRSMAAKELQLEATNEASYLARLEESFLEMYPLYTGATDDQTRAALAKIRDTGNLSPKDCCP